MDSTLEDLDLGSGVTILFGAKGGKYPDANAVLVEGANERLLLDTTPGLVRRGRAAIGPVDRILLTHCHEDHMAGNFLFPEVPIHLHTADLPGIQSLEAMLDLYGQEAERRARLRRLLLEDFNFVPRPDTQAMSDGDVFDLGGGVRIEVIHTPGHTSGHCAFFVRPLELLFLGDVDLSSFGPYYGDACSDLEEFESTLTALRDIEARFYLSGHHIGLLEGREAFLERLDRYGAKIVEREQRLLDYLERPRTMDEIVEHRFVYRPHDEVAGADFVERRSMEQHIERLLQQDRLTAVDGERYQAVS